ncbi:delta-class carbonic anhydrase [uncultured Roseobacter sp.]|uniref:delta-class carbonic anhydrase n=1 Tax=uncultured Roseobacter sp. TaxID=114847 RepID=UPI00261F812F|nr:delta-class carbonic anhydrase [uncultured Roseobacter sp.]
MKSALTLVLSLSAITAGATAVAEAVTDDDIAAQRAALAAATEGAGFGPQSPRDLSVLTGDNARVFARAPAHTEMNLCNIHFHENAEHKGGEFTTYAGNGNGKGAGTGFKYDGTLTEAELAPYDGTVGAGKYGDLQPGDTIELHYVYTTAQVTPGPTLGSCLSEAIGNPQLRVEAQVFVLVNDDAALDFTEAARVEVVDSLHQAPGIPTDTGTPILYPGSTTGPSFNEAGSPLQVTWSVRPEVAKVSIRSVEAWLADNVFDEDHAHGVRNLVVNPALLSPIY